MIVAFRSAPPLLVIRTEDPQDDVGLGLILTLLLLLLLPEWIAEFIFVLLFLLLLLLLLLLGRPPAVTAPADDEDGHAGDSLGL